MRTCTFSFNWRTSLLKKNKKTENVCHKLIICARRCVAHSAGGPLQGFCIAAVHHLMN